MRKDSMCRRVFATSLAPLVLLSSAAGAQGLQRCDKPIGTMAVVEPQSEAIIALRRYNLESPTSLIRVMIQQSNCFVVLERGAAMQNLMRERELAMQGELQQGSNVSKGQMKAADFILTPNVIFSERNAGGIGGVVGGVLGSRNPMLGVLAGGLKFREAQTSILVSSVRTGVQVASGEGKAKKRDFGLGMLGLAGGQVGGVVGYTNTNEGKVIAASFLDNFNTIVTSMRGSGVLPVSTRTSQTGTGASFAEGDVVRPKIDKVEVLAEPSDAARTVGTAQKSDELVFLGEEIGGFVKVQGAAVEGWVKKTLVAKK